MQTFSKKIQAPCRVLPTHFSDTTTKIFRDTPHTSLSPFHLTAATSPHRRFLPHFEYTECAYAIVTHAQFPTVALLMNGGGKRVTARSNDGGEVAERQRVEGASLENLVVGPLKLVGKTLPGGLGLLVIFLENVCIIETPTPGPSRSPFIYFPSL